LNANIVSSGRTSPVSTSGVVVQPVKRKKDREAMQIKVMIIRKLFISISLYTSFLYSNFYCIIFM
jgi:hypothetical protein